MHFLSTIFLHTFYRYLQSFGIALRLWLCWSLSQRWSALLFTPPGDPQKKIAAASNASNASNASGSVSERFFNVFSWMLVVGVVTTVVSVCVYFMLVSCESVILRAGFLSSKIFVLILLSVGSADIARIGPVIKLKSRQKQVTTRHPFQLVHCPTVSGSTPDSDGPGATQSWMFFFLSFLRPIVRNGWWLGVPLFWETSIC